MLSANKPECFLFSPEAHNYIIKMMSARLKIVKIGFYLPELNSYRLSLSRQNAKYSMRCFVDRSGQVMYGGQTPEQRVAASTLRRYCVRLHWPTPGRRQARHAHIPRTALHLTH